MGPPERLPRTLKGFTATALTLGALSFAGCSSSAPDKIDPVGEVIEEIQGGTTDTTHKFAVGICIGARALADCTSGRVSIGICTGALILPNVVATARHCVSDAPELIDCTTSPSFGSAREGVWITTRSSLFSGSTTTGWYKAKNVFYPPDARVCGNDIALIVLDKSVPDSEAKPIAPNIQYLMSDAKYAASFTALGYGRTSPVTSPVSDGGEGTRRVLAGIPITCIPGSSTLACPSSVPVNEFVAGDGVCQGDSGSSAFESTSFAANAPVSFGVLSRGGANTANTKCEGSIYSRFDAHRAFILESVKTASASWTLYPEPAWTAFIEGSTPKGPLVAPSTEGGKPPVPVAAQGSAALGETCAKNKDCASNLCIGFDDGTHVCSKACGSTETGSTCSTGYECTENVCIKSESPDTTPLAATPAPPDTGETGCSLVAGTSSGASHGWLVGMGLVVLAVRRRKA